MVVDGVISGYFWCCLQTFMDFVSIAKRTLDSSMVSIFKSEKKNTNICQKPWF